LQGLSVVATGWSRKANEIYLQSIGADRFAGQPLIFGADHFLSALPLACSRHFLMENMDKAKVARVLELTFIRRSTHLLPATQQRIGLFRSFFRGRKDICDKRWTNADRRSGNPGALPDKPTAEV
jgi:hypothetical protein